MKYPIIPYLPPRSFMFVDEHVITADGEPCDCFARINVNEIVGQIKQIVGFVQLHQNGDVKRKARRVIWIWKNEDGFDKNHGVSLFFSILNHEKEAQWIETVWNRRIQFVDKNPFPMSSVVSERASERMSAAERASEVSSAEQAKEWVVRANGGANGPLLYALIS